MTLNDMARALLIEFAAREVGPKGSLEEMKAVLWCVRNRVKAGWHDGDWIEAIQSHYDSSAAAHNEPERAALDFKARALQRMMHEIDSIFYADRMNFDESEADGIEASIQRHNCKYWQFLKRETRLSFAAEIVRDQKNHPMRAQMGLMMFFE